jgi:hypothetical protein
MAAGIGGKLAAGAAGVPRTPGRATFVPIDAALDHHEDAEHRDDDGQDVCSERVWRSDPDAN